ncbi:MAG: hypothetical protein ACRD1E_05805 [Terriglobales bacterium]
MVLGLGIKVRVRYVLIALGVITVALGVVLAAEGEWWVVVPDALFGVGVAWVAAGSLLKQQPPEREPGAAMALEPVPPPPQAPSQGAAVPPKYPPIRVEAPVPSQHGRRGKRRKHGT